MHRQLKPKKAEVRLYQLFIWQQKTFYLSFVANKTMHISFKSGCVVQVAKHLKGDWLIVLQLQFWICIAVKNFHWLKYKACLKAKFKCICVTMCSLVMILFSRDFI